MIPVRWNMPNHVTTVRTLNAPHPLIGSECPACDVPLSDGDDVALVYVGPGPDADSQERAADGRWHTGAAVAVHAACAGARVEAAS